MLYWVYSVIGTAFYFLLLPAVPLFSLIRPGTGRSLRMRMGGILPVSGPGGSATLWIHAASVGEVQAAGLLINKLLTGGEDYNIVLTTMTEYGRKVAETQLPGSIHCLPAPLDVPCAVKKFLGKIDPDMYIGLETELWPALLTELRHSGVRCTLLNGRMSDRSFNRYRLIRKSLGKLLSVFSAVSVIQDSDKARFVFFGVPESRVQVTGNIKFDLPTANRDAFRKKYRKLLGLDGEQLFLCGSTRSGEEDILAGVFQELRERCAGELVWLVAPRHLERLAEVRRTLERYGLQYGLFSELKAGKKERTTPVVLVDTMGDLADMYSAGDYIFCGGSLVDKGGHNLMEAARWGVPVYYGPNMNDFRDAAELLETNGAGFRVTGSRQLVRIILHHMEDRTEYHRAGKNALEVVKRQQGSAGRQANLVKTLLPAGRR